MWCWWMHNGSCQLDGERSVVLSGCDGEQKMKLDGCGLTSGREVINLFRSTNSLRRERFVM